MPALPGDQASPPPEEAGATDERAQLPAISPRVLPFVLAALIIASYALSLRGGFLNYDDDWLIRDNPVFPRPDALRTIWTDRSPETRHLLGAEYLPVRDTLVWLELRLFGPSAFAFRSASLLLYLAGALLLRQYLRRTLPAAVAETSAWLFALHPVHAESVAWLAGQKDLVALLLVAAALLVYARDRQRWAVPLLLLGAMFGKSVAVTAPLLLLLHDHVTRRRPRWPVIAASLAATVVALVVHVRVGRTVGMMAAWPGGSRLSAFTTMGPVWLRYLGESFVPVGLSLHREVPTRTAGDGLAWLSYAILLALALATALAARKDRRLWPWALGWFVLPLLPTSQILAPLQNLMADRYLLLAVLGPCAVVAALATRAPRPVTAGLVLIAAALTFARAQTFADSVSLWEDTTARSPQWGQGWYQLGMALREAHPAEAEPAFRRALEVEPAAESARRAANNLAALLAGQERLPEAQALLRVNTERFPDDPRALNNLAEITARLGQEPEARRLYDRLVSRFPDYGPGLRNYRKRYGVTSPARPGSPPSPGPPPAR
jgi:tetratricopeptide (TPR) repeat protein